jgi:hypothetical protein
MTATAAATPAPNATTVRMRWLTPLLYRPIFFFLVFAGVSARLPAGSWKREAGSWKHPAIVAKAFTLPL